MESRRNLLKIIGGSALFAPGISEFASPATAKEGTTLQSSVSVSRTKANIARLDITVEDIPDDVPQVGGQDFASFVELDNSIYLKKKTSDVVVEEKGSMLVVGNHKFHSIAPGDSKQIADGACMMCSDEGNFLGTFFERVSISTDGNFAELTIGDEGVLRVQPGATETTQRELKISYTTYGDISKELQTTVNFTFENLGKMTIIGNPSHQVVPAQHRLGRLAEKMAQLQQKESRSGVEATNPMNGQILKTATSLTRVVTADEGSYVVQTKGRELSEGDF